MIVVSTGPEDPVGPYLVALIANGVDPERIRVASPGTAKADVMSGAQALLLCGGADVEPARYGEVAIDDAGVSPVPERDALEWELLDAVLHARPDLRDDLRRALAREVDDPLATVDDLRRTDPRAYRALVMLVLAAYYRSPDVQARIGWPGPVGTAVGRFDYPEYLSEGLLDHVLAKERHA